MVSYKCKRCGYSCNNKSYIKKHLLRKKHCKPILEDIEIRQLYDDIYGKGEYIKLTQAAENKKNVKYAQIRSNTLKYAENKKYSEKIEKNTLKYAENKTKEENNVSIKLNNKEHLCKICGKIFKEKRYLVQHINRGSCKKIELDKYNQNEFIDNNDTIRDNKDIIIASQQILIEELKKQVEVLLKEKGNTYTYTQNIIIQPFGQENTNYIKAEYINNLIDKSPVKCIPKLLQELHFNKEHQENCNVKIPNKKQSFAQIFDGTNWVYKDKRDTIDNMTNKAYKIINKHYDSGSNNYMDLLKENIDNNNKNVIKQISKDTEIMILNNQSLENQIT